MMAHLVPDHPSLSPPPYNGKDMVGNQIGLKESWQVLFLMNAYDTGKSYPAKMCVQHLSSFPAAQPGLPLASPAEEARILP